LNQDYRDMMEIIDSYWDVADLEEQKLIENMEANYIELEEN